MGHEQHQELLLLESGHKSCNVEISSFSSPHVNMSISNHSTTRKSWRSDAPIILPGWECRTGGSRSKPTVHRCRPKTGGCGLLTRTQDEPTKNNMVAETTECADVPDVSIEERKDGLSSRVSPEAP